MMTYWFLSALGVAAGLAACGGDAASESTDANPDPPDAATPVDAGNADAASSLCEAQAPGWVQLGDELGGEGREIGRIDLDVTPTPTVAWEISPTSASDIEVRVAERPSGGAWARLGQAVTAPSGKASLAHLARNASHLVLSTFEYIDSTPIDPFHTYHRMNLRLARYRDGVFSGLATPINQNPALNTHFALALTEDGTVVLTFAEYYFDPRDPFTPGPWPLDFWLASVSPTNVITREHPRRASWAEREHVYASHVFHHPDTQVLSLLAYSVTARTMVMLERAPGGTWQDAAIPTEQWYDRAARGPDGAIYAMQHQDRTLRRVNDDAWLQVTSSVPEHERLAEKLEFDPAGRPMVLAQAQVEGGLIVLRVYRWEEDAWMQVGDDLPIADATLLERYTFAFDVDACGRPVVAVAWKTPSDAGPRLAVYRHDEGIAVP